MKWRVFIDFILQTEIKIREQVREPKCCAHWIKGNVYPCLCCLNLNEHGEHSVRCKHFISSIFCCCSFFLDFGAVFSPVRLFSKIPWNGLGFCVCSFLGCQHDSDLSLSALKRTTISFYIRDVKRLTFCHWNTMLLLLLLLLRFFAGHCFFFHHLLFGWLSLLSIYFVDKVNSWRGPKKNVNR